MTEINVIFDIDDVLNNLNDVVFETLGIKDKLKDIKHFNVSDNVGSVLTKEEADKIIEMYGDANTFARVQVASDKVKDIMKLERLSTNKCRVNVKIYSACYTESIKAEKLKFLSTKIGVRLENITFSGMDKKPLAVNKTDVVVEDNGEWLESYDDCIKILIDKPYNREYKNVNRMSNIDEALEFIEETIKKTINKAESM